MVISRAAAVVTLLAIVSCADVLSIERLPPADDDSGNGGAGGSGSASGATAGSGGEFVCPRSDSTADCAALCALVAAAGCTLGPPQLGCEDACNTLNETVGICPEWGGLVDCMGDEPTFVCLGGDEPIAEGCYEEFYCFSMCNFD